jgi:OOP family OmpA-OmpF porin
MATACPTPTTAARTGAARRCSRAARTVDEDGVADMDDGCPEHAGAAALGGCPDVDGDGVADPQDACPTLPGEARFSGCTDRDGDGVADADDRCPAAPGPVERAGCPEPPARDLRRLEGPVPGLRFARGSARLLPGSDRAIEEVAKLLVAWPDLVLVVEGHTARQGSRDAALTLSEARAEVVALRLVALGVAARRITSVGRGFDAPIASNKTGAGARAKRADRAAGCPANRRVRLGRRSSAAQGPCG